MRNLRTGFVALLALAFLVDLAAAEPPDPNDGQPRDRQGGPGGPRRGHPGDRGPGHPFGPPPPLVIALDADKDGVISAKEIENAAAALKTLDKNNDGKLTREELRPQFDGRGGPRGRRSFRGPGRPGDRQGDRGPGRPFGGEGFIERILRFDQNKDGKVSKDELPERMQRIFDRADTDKDGDLDKDELKKMAERFRQRGRRGRPGEDGRGGRPGDGDRRQRPKQPQDSGDEKTRIDKEFWQGAWSLKSPRNRQFSRACEVRYIASGNPQSGGCDQARVSKRFREDQASDRSVPFQTANCEYSA